MAFYSFVHASSMEKSDCMYKMSKKSGLPL